ncbi:MAG: hypothetical protein NWF14_02225 [Candidatus Bathyarchaeota archaeon]|nr:hypothetical protein [Candidatus Bathyarchaeota archaeon]
MSPRTGYIHVRRVLKDFLKEQRTALSDLRGVMDEGKEGIMEALRGIVNLTDAQVGALERGLRSKELNLLLFVVQAFYLLNPSGMYKGFIIEPVRDNVVWGEKATFEGCKAILKALHISTKSLDI